MFIIQIRQNKVNYFICSRYKRLGNSISQERECAKLYKTFQGAQSALTRHLKKHPDTITAWSITSFKGITWPLQDI